MLDVRPISLLELLLDLIANVYLLPKLDPEFDELAFFVKIFLDLFYFFTEHVGGQ